MKKIDIMRAKGLLNSQNELLLYGVIGDWWEGMDAAGLVAEIEAISTPNIVVRIHSRGGNVLEGLSMYNALVNSSKPVHVYIDGVCASIATVIAMAADKGHLYTPDNALWMIHKPWADTSGNADQLREDAKNLDVVAESMIAAYIASGRVTEERIREIFSTAKDYYMTGAEAVTEGFADELMASVQAAASIDMTTMPEPQGRHKELYDFYAVNAAPTHRRNHKEPTMKLKKLLALMSALTAQGIAEKDMNASLAKAFDVKVDAISALLDEENSEASDQQLQAGIDALAAMQNSPAPQGRQQQQSGNPSDPVAIADAANAAIAAERKRSAAITALASQHGLSDQLRDRLINDGASIEDARAQALDFLASEDGQRQPLPGVRVTDPMGPAFKEGAINAMLNRLQPVAFKLEEGGKDFRGMSLLDIASACLERVGVNTRGMTKNELAIKAMHTTSDFPLVVADVANKVLMRAYTAQPRTFLPVANQTTLSDFKTKHNIEIGGGSELLEVKENGEFEQGSVTEGEQTYKLNTYGRVFHFSRQLLINDDIGALNQFMMNIGALAARKENSIVWSLVKTGAIFSTGNGNLVSSGGAPSEAQLNKNRKLFRQMVGLDSEPLNIVAKYLVVNSEHETTAQKLLSSVLASATGDVNVYANSMELIVEPLLDGVSNNPWYTFADPMVVPTIEYAYLEGEAGPYIETRNGFDVDGMDIKVRHDFGAGWQGSRGAVKNPGA